MRWMAVGEVAHIIRESLPGGNSRIRIGLGPREGKRIRLDLISGGADGIRTRNFRRDRPVL